MHEIDLTPSVKTLSLDIESCQPDAPQRYATLSFPVANNIPVVDSTPVTKVDTIAVITALMCQRKPALLLCAGWSMENGAEDLERLRQASRDFDGLVVVESCPPEPTHAYRLESGTVVDMGPQSFKKIEDRTSAACADFLNGLQGERVFAFRGKKVLFLMCGELGVVEGRVAPKIFTGLQGMEPMESYGLVLNPTHTRMGNGGTLNAKREFLSRYNRTYLSASNWDVVPSPETGKRQWPSRNIHSCWINGKPQEQCWSCPPEPGYHPDFIYREWKIV